MVVFGPASELSALLLQCSLTSSLELTGEVVLKCFSHVYYNAKPIKENSDLRFKNRVYIFPVLVQNKKNSVEKKQASLLDLPLGSDPNRLFPVLGFKNFHQVLILMSVSCRRHIIKY